MGTLKEDIALLQTDVRELCSRLNTVERNLAVMMWLLGISTAVITAIAAEVAKRLLMP